MRRLNNETQNAEGAPEPEETSHERTTRHSNREGPHSSGFGDHDTCLRRSVSAQERLTQVMGLEVERQHVPTEEPPGAKRGPRRAAVPQSPVGLCPVGLKTRPTSTYPTVPSSAMLGTRPSTL